MTYLSLPSDETRRLSFYLAMEEYATRSTNDGSPFFFLWQVEPTVIFGRHQVIENEVNITYCTRSDQVQTTFKEYMQMVCTMLKELGLDATSTENNDVLIGGRKVSGNAFYHLPGWSIVHGTMLFDTDMRHMLSAITPPKQKLDKHGVESVRQRITLLKEHTDLSIEAFKDFAKQKLCSDELKLTEEDVRNIETIEQEYLNPEFIYGKENMSL